MGLIIEVASIDRGYDNLALLRTDIDIDPLMSWRIILVLKYTDHTHIHIHICCNIDY